MLHWPLPKYSQVFQCLHLTCARSLEFRTKLRRTHELSTLRTGREVDCWLTTCRQLAGTPRVVFVSIQKRSSLRIRQNRFRVQVLRMLPSPLATVVATTRKPARNFAPEIARLASGGVGFLLQARLIRACVEWGMLCKTRRCLRFATRRLTTDCLCSMRRTGTTFGQQRQARTTNCLWLQLP